MDYIKNIVRTGIRLPERLFEWPKRSRCSIGSISAHQVDHQDILSLLISSEYSVDISTLFKAEISVLEFLYKMSSILCLPIRPLCFRTFLKKFFDIHNLINRLKNLKALTRANHFLCVHTGL